MDNLILSPEAHLAFLQKEVERTDEAVAQIEQSIENAQVQRAQILAIRSALLTAIESAALNVTPVLPLPDGASNIIAFPQAHPN